MQITSRQATTYLIAAQIAALVAGYVIRSPSLQAEAERKTQIHTSETAAAYEQQEAMNRAQRCLVLMTSLPITDGGAAYFSSLQGGRVVIHRNRPMPSGTTVCDRFGNTGIIAFNNEGEPIISDIKRLASEEMTKILKDRGVTK
jgi:hypothetical protein